MSLPKWIGGLHPAKWTFKTKIPTHLQTGAQRVDFGLYGMAYIYREIDGRVLMTNGGKMPCFDFYLATPGHVIGPRDIQAAGSLPWAHEWRASCGDRIADDLDLNIKEGGPR